MTTELSAHRTRQKLHCAQLAVIAGPDIGFELEWEARELRIGTSSSCDVVLTDPTVSGHHCVIRLDSHGASIHDLGSTNGTIVGGFRLTTAYLKPGSIIRLGHTEIYFSGSARKNGDQDWDGFGLVLGRSPAMKRLYAKMRRIASAPTTILIEGETGTGKDLIAETIHQASNRSNGPFVVFDCARVTASLMSAELFGHVRGAFTGADAGRMGLVEGGHGGTVFFDEIGELPLDLQPALLRVLEKREVTRIGANNRRKLDVRIIAATNRSLDREVAAGRFRQDLFYRLNIMKLEVPPLRERAEDIELLANHFLRQISGEDATVPREMLKLFQGYQWPGNVRELRSIIERWVVFGRPDRRSTVNMLMDSDVQFGDETGGASDSDETFRESKARAVEQWEREYLRSLMGRHDGNVSSAARSVRMNRNHLATLLKRHGLAE